jgi:hypothetical protein
MSVKTWALKVAKIWVGPVGQVCTGNVLDVGKGPFERALKDYDSLLYVKWNPKKLRGHGCWEIRRRPEMKSVVEVVPFQGNTLVRIEYVEYDVVNHVLDCAFLNYDQLRKLKEMDLFTKHNLKYLVDNIESSEAAHREAIDKKRLEERKMLSKEFKREIRDFKDLVASGHNPGEMISKHWGK